MRQLTVWKKIWNAVRFLVEIFIPVCAFLVMFISFIYGIGARYLFNSPSPKSMELQTIGFVICVLTSVQVASRYVDHVTFDLLYNRMSPRIRAYCRTAGNLLISVFCAVMIPAAVRYLRQLTVGTPLLKLPRGILFAPFVLMLAQAAVQYLYRAWRDIRGIREKHYEQDYNRGEKGDLI